MWMELKNRSWILKVSEEEIILVSGKTGQGVDILLEEIIKKVPAPKLGNSTK